MNITPVRSVVAAIAMVIPLALGACEKASDAPAKPSKSAAAEPLPPALFLASAPAEALSVEDAKKTAKAGGTVVLRGRVGGSRDPFVEGRAVLTLVGPGLPACSDNPDDACKTPWDYCCEEKRAIAEHSATVQVLDGAGAPLRATLKGHGGIRELSDLIVVGNVAVADGATLVVNATGIFVAKP